MASSDLFTLELSATPPYAASSMNLKQYQQQKLERSRAIPTSRRYCHTCKKPVVTCYCHRIKPFDSDPQFVILIHPDELKRSIATGRMAHLCLNNSYFFEGLDFSQHAQVQALINDTAYHPMLLFPDNESTNLSSLSAEHKATLTPNGKKLLIFVLDGTWDQARSMKHRSENLRALPRICFTPPGASQFKVRKQPEAYCYSTIESIHHLIALMGKDRDGAADNLIETFSYLVGQQLDYAAKKAAVYGLRATRGHRGSYSNGL